MKKIVYIILVLFIVNTAKSQCLVPLNYDTSLCASNFSITIDASVLDTSLCSDSVTIVLNAANTVLANDTNVYLYSAPQFTPFIPWGTNPYTTGSTTQNNGIGRMTYLGNNMWTITIHPQTYYNYPADTCLNGIWMVFHNYNGSIYLNSDDATSNFFVLTKTTGNAVSEIDPDTVMAHKKVGNVMYKWSDNNTTNPRTFTTGGNYTVTATSVGGCTASGSVAINVTSLPAINLGKNDTICTGDSLKLTVPAGFIHYTWNNTDTTQSITVNATNNYSVTAVNSSGCTATGSIQITTDTNSTNFPVITIIPSDSVVCGGAYTTLQANTGFTSYTWNTGASTSYLYVKDSGTYTLTVTNSFGCSKSSSFSIDTCTIAIDTMPTKPVVGCGSPTADFIVLSIGPDNSVTFKDKSQIAKILSYLWNFGDGTTDSDTGSTVHTYATAGNYTVILQVKDSCGGTSGDTIRVNVNVTGIPVTGGLASLNIFPNPTSGAFNVQLSLEEQKQVSFLLYNSLGQPVWQEDKEINSGITRMAVDAGNLTPGIYILELMNNSERTIKKITLTK